MNQRTMSHPNRLLPWIVCVLGALLFCYGYIHRVAPSVMVADLMREFSVSGAILGSLSACFFYAYAGIQIPVGVMVDRWGSRRLLAMASAVCGLAGVMFAYADTLGVAYAARLLIGAGAGCGLVATMKLIGNWFPPERFALVAGVTVMLGMSGGVFGQAPQAALVEAVGWRGAVAAVGIGGLVLAAAQWLVVRDTPGETVTPSKRDGDGLLSGLRSAVATPQTWYTGLFGAMVTAPLSAFGGLWGVPYMMEAFGLGRPEAAFCVSLMLVGWAIGAPLTGWLSDHVRLRRLPMMLVAGGSLVTFCLLIYLPGLPLLAAQVLFLGNGVFAGGMIIYFAAARECNRLSAAGAMMGFMNTLVMVLSAILQPLMGWLLDLNWDGRAIGGARLYAVDDYRTACLALVACYVLAFVSAWKARETHCRQVQT